MKIYVLKLTAALLNLIIVSYIVRYLPNSLSEQYLLSLAYIVLGSLLFGLGIDTALERYVSRMTSRWRKSVVASVVILSSVMRILLLITGVFILESYFPNAIKITPVVLLLAFTTFLFTSCSSLLNGVFRYTEAAFSNVLRALLRFAIVLLPIEIISLDRLLEIEIASCLLSASFCLVVFARQNFNNSPVGTAPFGSVIARFMGWNWAGRLLLNLLSLNTVKILVLRSGHPHAVLIAYIIQLTEAVERFLPSLVLAGKYRPLLARDFDEGRTANLTLQLRSLGVKSAAFAAAISVCHLALLPVALFYIQGADPWAFQALIILCASWLFINNLKFSVNTVSNVLERNHVPFWASLILCALYFGGMMFFDITSPVGIFSLLAVLTVCYPVLWFWMSYQYLRQTLKR